MGRACIASAVPLQKTAGDVEDRFVIEILPIDPQVAQKRDAFGVAQQKGRFVIRRSGITVFGPFPSRDPKHHPQSIAVGTHGAAGRSRRRAGTWHPQ
jgi:hypothetical protein